MTDVYFYHLQNQPLEKVLPQLLEKCLERGWRCVVQTQTDERAVALDQHLWTWRDDSFLPHGTERDSNAPEQPVLLTTSDANANAAKVRFFVEGASSEDLAGYERAIHLFDGNDPDAVDNARVQWKRSQAAGHSVTYWQQDEAGRWQQKA
ncbi:MAG: DNA polymerase III subunit chi [Xanthobacteraceae bacterium]